MGKILLYYKYVDIENPEIIIAWQRQLCATLNLKGRILIAHEGINATVGGTYESIESYKQAVRNHELFCDIEFKESLGSADYFPRLKVQLKKEIVRLGIDPEELSAKDAGQYLTPERAHKLISQNPEDLVLLDTRNNYESRVGTFINALIPNTETFREFPEYIDNNLEHFKNKQVLMFCTGGIRCERASAYLKNKKIAKAVYHIKGGIAKYVEEFPKGFFKGKNYVFDGRIATKVTEDILAQCEHCTRAYDEYSNCINAECNKQIIVCPQCIHGYHNTCSPECLALVQADAVNIRLIPYKISLESPKNQD